MTKKNLDLNPVQIDKLQKNENDVEVSYLMGKFKPELHPDFIEIPEKYADRPGLLLRKEAFDAFLKMDKAAKAEGVYLKIRSATRNFDYQKGIWENKWNGKILLSDGTNVSKDIVSHQDKALKILRYSSMPGTSRHHWGTDIDLNAFSNTWFENGEGLVIYNWLLEHAAFYGYCQPYTALGKDRPTGYQEEKWHWSFMPLSKTFTQAAELKLSDDLIKGFAGADVASEIKVVENYVLGINQNCK
jgi:LAS superfamily LD-carboxypeptidase LdcB